MRTSFADTKFILKIYMIIALAGRRIDAADAETERFPLEMKDAVRQKILQLFMDERVTALVSSAACGADLLAQDAARELGIRRHIVLPFGEEKFRRTSVTDRPGDWGALFDTICREARDAGNLIDLKSDAVEAAAYAAATDKVLELAEDLRREENEAAIAVVVWNGKAKNADDETARFAEAARRRKFGAAEILTVRGEIE